MTSTILIPLLVFLGALLTAVAAGALLASSADPTGLRPTRSAVRAMSFGLPCGR